MIELKAKHGDNKFVARNSLFLFCGTLKLGYCVSILKVLVDSKYVLPLILVKNNFFYRRFERVAAKFDVFIHGLLIKTNKILNVTVNIITLLVFRILKKIMKPVKQAYMRTSV